MNNTKFPEDSFYLYRHIREDKNEPFYIGIGSQKDYGRARVRCHRNSTWNTIASKTNWYWEIVLDELTKEEAIAKEKEFIALYGRKDLKTGILANRTDGGDASEGITRESIERARQKKLGRVGYLCKNSKEIIGLSPDGIERKFGSGADAARILEKETGLKFAQSAISLCCRKDSNVCSHYGWKFKLVGDLTLWEDIRTGQGKWVLVIEPNGNEKRFDSLRESCNYYSKLLNKNINNATASAVCLGTRNHHHGLIFKYV